MRIRITKCSSPSFWYKDHINKEYEVAKDEGTEEDFAVKAPGMISGLVLKDDCVVLSDDNIITGNETELESSLPETKEKFVYVIELFTKSCCFDSPYQRLFFNERPEYRIDGTTVYINIGGEESKDDFKWKCVPGTLKDLERIFLGIVRIDLFKRVG